MTRIRKTAAFRTKIIVAGFMILSFGIGTRLAPPVKPAVRLPAPTGIAETRYSGPLTLTHVSESVLGAETIDPLDFVTEINRERSKAGSPELRVSPTLMRAAKLRVEVMKKYQNFSHLDPHEGIELASVLPRLNYHFSWATENIGMGGVSAPDFVNGFMHSPSHKTNLLDPRLTDTGAAFADGPYRQYYVNYAVQLFAIPSGTDEFRGYSDADLGVYDAALAAVRANLHPLVRLVRALRGQRAYTDAYYRKLERQRVILEAIIPDMKRSVPFTNREVSLVLEYNSLL